MMPQQVRDLLAHVIQLCDYVDDFNPTLGDLSILKAKGKQVKSLITEQYNDERQTKAETGHGAVPTDGR